MDDSQALENWNDLNLALMASPDEERCARLLELEKNGKRRLQFLFRIHSRLNRLRAERERSELRKLTGG